MVHPNSFGQFLEASVGFGGSCFQKDVLNLVYLCRHYGLEEVADYWHQVIKINDYQKDRFAQKIIDHFGGDLTGKKITILGWAFKANTNDSRESPAIYVADKLLSSGAILNIFDPMITECQIKMDLKSLWKNRNLDSNKILHLISKVNVFNDQISSIQNSEAVGILTDWEAFKKIKGSDFSTQPLIFDGRNISHKPHYSIGK